ncbi:UNVERIFIED_CONTAM: hypothetical protein Slati_1011900 [Sesamum latifolium]|uniref:Uncharacterized protein n=1 Tax=Sesamum latifolium TaxID=2727402 RepID=A0AAW2XRU8_9LAMI
MSRHLWKVISADRSSIWVDWIFRTHLRTHSIWTIPANNGSWGWRKLLRLRGALKPYVKYRSGSGDDFSLWHDPWHEARPFILHFPMGPRHTDIPPPHGLVVYCHSGWDLVLAVYQVHGKNGDNTCSFHDSWRAGSDYLEGGPKSVLF